MKISQDVRDYAAAKGINDEQDALAIGMDEKSKQFLEEGADIYHKV
jgi:phosphomethylpyrimidine synthase